MFRLHVLLTSSLTHQGPVWTINQVSGWWGGVGGGITGWPGVSRTSISVGLICVRSQTTDGHARGSTGDYFRPWKNKRNPSKCPLVSSESPPPLSLTASLVFTRRRVYTETCDT